MLEDYSKYSELNRVPVIDVPITGKTWQIASIF